MSYFPASSTLSRILISLHLVGASVWIGGHLVLATGNKSELAVGYSTIYGDSVGGFGNRTAKLPSTLVNSVQPSFLQERSDTNMEAFLKASRLRSETKMTCTTITNSTKLSFFIVYVTLR